MEPLMTMVSLKLKGMLRKERRGAAVLETVILLVVAIVIIGLIVNKFVKGDESYINQIFKRIEDIFNLNK